jgi:type I restriction enzyme S subunit
LRVQRCAVLAQLNTLAEAIFLDMFGDPIANPRGWSDHLRLHEVADIASGVTIGRKVTGQPTKVVPYLAVSNVQDGDLDLHVVKNTVATNEEISRYRLLPGDLLLTEGGDPDKLGRGTIWRGEIPDCIHQNHVFRARLNGDTVTSLYLSHLLRSQRGKAYFLRAAKQTTGIASINMTQLRNFPLLTPPLSVQLEFGRRIEAVGRLKSAVGESSEALDAVFVSLQDRAFRGEL